MFPKYYVLQKLLNIYMGKCDTRNIYIISVQHLLRSTGSLFESLIMLGINPENIFVTGKLYSTHTTTAEGLQSLGVNVIPSTIPDRLGHYSDYLEKDVQRMWDTLIRKISPGSQIIILDDGGYTLKNTPERIIREHVVFGIEQTTSGIRMQNTFGKFPVIHLAASAAKVLIEPPIVSEAVKIRLGNYIHHLRPDIIGVVGLGHIGQAVVKELSDNYQIIVFDRTGNRFSAHKENIMYCDTLNELYTRSNLIIGATGVDISDLDWLENSRGNKVLISVSSGDIEFNRLLRACKPYMTETLQSPLQVLRLKTRQGHILEILRGGMVANFTGQPDSSPGEIIQITRGLLLGAVLQLLRDCQLMQQYSGPVMLDPEIQQKVVGLWLEDQPQRRNHYSRDVLDGFEDVEWIKKYSAGEYFMPQSYRK